MFVHICILLFLSIKRIIGNALLLIATEFCDPTFIEALGIFSIALSATPELKVIDSFVNKARWRVCKNYWYRLISNKN